ncbi:hypothetical protein [Roseibium sp.]|uniref:hypothetical protein n=1 Tax=Roseibium sp. TaxID=1936156 RepID=UPI00391BD146
MSNTKANYDLSLSGKGSGPVWFIAGALVTAIAAGIFFYTQWYAQDDEVSIELTVPSISVE